MKPSLFSLLLALLPAAMLPAQAPPQVLTLDDCLQLALTKKEEKK